MTTRIVLPAAGEECYFACEMDNYNNIPSIVHEGLSLTQDFDINVENGTLVAPLYDALYSSTYNSNDNVRIKLGDYTYIGKLNILHAASDYAVGDINPTNFDLSNEGLYFIYLESYKPTYDPDVDDADYRRQAGIAIVVRDVCACTMPNDGSAWFYSYGTGDLYRDYAGETLSVEIGG